MKLYSYFRSSAAFRVRIALALKGVLHSTEFVDLRRGGQDGAFADINPQRLVPFLEDDGLGLSQSLAIVEYLEETYPEPSLLPDNSGDRAVVRSMAQAIACDIHPLNNLRVLRYLKRSLGIEQDEIDSWYGHWIHLGFEALEPMLREHGDGLHCFGSNVTLADVCLVPQVWNAKAMKIDLSPYPTICAIYDALIVEQAFQMASPENQEDAT